MLGNKKCAGKKKCREFQSEHEGRGTKKEERCKKGVERNSDPKMKIQTLFTLVLAL